MPLRVTFDTATLARLALGNGLAIIPSSATQTLAPLKFPLPPHSVAVSSFPLHNGSDAGGDWSNRPGHRVTA
jgi:hypothetical protein